MLRLTCYGCGSGVGTGQPWDLFSGSDIYGLPNAWLAVDKHCNYPHDRRLCKPLRITTMAMSLQNCK